METLINLFLKEIETKNSWGKNEVIDLFKDCVIKALLGDKK